MKKPCNLDDNDIARVVRSAMETYLHDLEGAMPSASVHEMVMNCVEKPLLETVLHHAGGNQTRAADLLGINRNTLRKKMQTLGIQ